MKIQEWIAEHDLVVINTEKVKIYDGPRSGSVIDITLATSAISAKMEGWRVMEDVEKKLSSKH